MQITIREPGSAITHYIGMLLSLISAIPLLVKASQDHSSLAEMSMLIFCLAMISLYAASTLYHALNVREKILLVFRKIDHMMIFVLIAGTYTPICLLVLDGKQGHWMLFLIWELALVGMLIKAFWVTCPKWFSSIIYIAMGWACLLVFPELLQSLSTAGFGWLLAGGLFYTIGGIIYALHFQKFNLLHKYFGTHEIFHLFVMAGSFCHFITMYYYLV